MGKPDWEKANRQEKARGRNAKKKRDTVAVHPNSMAARKWNRKTWQTTVLPKKKRRKRKGPGALPMGNSRPEPG